MIKNFHLWNAGDKKEPPYDFSKIFIIGEITDRLSDYLALVEEARKDFPFICDEEIDIGKISRPRQHRGRIVISFMLASFDEKEIRDKGYGIYYSFDYSWQ